MKITYRIDYVTDTSDGVVSLVAEDEKQAVRYFYEAGVNPDRIITAMTRVFVDGKRVDEDVPCFPAALGGGPVDLTYKPDHLEADIEEGREIMQELFGVPEELR